MSSVNIKGTIAGHVINLTVSTPELTDDEARRSGDLAALFIASFVDTLRAEDPELMAKLS